MGLEQPCALGYNLYINLDHQLTHLIPFITSCYKKMTQDLLLECKELLPLTKIETFIPTKLADIGDVYLFHQSCGVGIFNLQLENIILS